jgi:hypothetical protein
LIEEVGGGYRIPEEIVNNTEMVKALKELIYEKNK